MATAFTVSVDAATGITTGISAADRAAGAFRDLQLRPTADGFETYGVTGVALISFICLAVFEKYQAELIPPALLIRRWFADEQAALEKLEADCAALQQQMEEMAEEHGGEEGLLAEVLDEMP